MSGKAYVVVNAAGQFLRTEGPFGYPRWINSIADAEIMSYGRASQCAEAHGGTARPADASFGQTVSGPNHWVSG